MIKFVPRPSGGLSSGPIISYHHKWPQRGRGRQSIFVESCSPGLGPQAAVRTRRFSEQCPGQHPQQPMPLLLLRADSLMSHADALQDFSGGDKSRDQRSVMFTERCPPPGNSGPEQPPERGRGSRGNVPVCERRQDSGPEQPPVRGGPRGSVPGGIRSSRCC